MRMDKVSCIIPAYNEAPRIAGVLRAVVGHPLVAEVLVIDDCSRDDTANVVNGFNDVRFIRQPVNMGKSSAIARGITEAKSDFLLFLDADLVGLTPDDISRLIEPIHSGKADISLSLRRNTVGFWRWIGLDYLSGERVFSKQLVANHVQEIARLPGFGLEVFLNRLCIKKRLRFAVVDWPNVDSPWKYKKQGWWQGIQSEFRMNWQIVKTISPFGPFYQVFKIMGLKVK